MSEYNERKEIDEAINAANDVLYHLEKADEILKSAQNWGLVDIFGGGMITTMIKRNKMKEATNEIEVAKQAMRRLSKELRDIHGEEELGIEIYDFLGMADYFFDGFIVDWFVQSKLNNARKQMADAIAQVTGILDGLESIR